MSSQKTPTIVHIKEKLEKSRNKRIQSKSQHLATFRNKGDEQASLKNIGWEFSSTMEKS